MGGEETLTRDEIQDIINIANDIAEHTRLGTALYAENISSRKGFGYLGQRMSWLFWKFCLVHVSNPR